MDKLNFLTIKNLSQIKEDFYTPCFVYSEKVLNDQADKMLNFPNAYWLIVRYAMKTSSNLNILKLLHKKHIHIDASSQYEVIRAINAWIPASNIQLTSQKFPYDLDWLIRMWVLFNATSLYQLENFWKANVRWELSIRINPWLWSWWTNRTNVWGPASSFGIWHEYIDEAKKIIKKYDLKVTRLHTHIWSGSDPNVWTKVSDMSLNIVKKFPEVKVLNLWWWFKVWSMAWEKDADLNIIWNKVKQSFKNFKYETWRELVLEIEPWTYIAANSCSLVTVVQDICDTWKTWYKFLKLNSWMTELTRPSLYWAQHPIIVINDSLQREDYIVVWHACESWDIFTPAPWDPEWLKTRSLKKANIWDIVVIERSWSYASSMSTKNYNSYPEAWELLVRKSWEIVEIRKTEIVEDIWRNEIDIFKD